MGRGSGDDGRTQRERMLAGDAYIPGADAVLQEENLRAMELCDEYNRSSVRDAEERRRILVELLGSVGEDVVIRAPFHCDYGYQLHIGARTFINFGLIALDVAKIEIGADAQIGPGVQLLTATHPLDPAFRRSGVEGSSPIRLGDNVWLGGGVIVCPGVSVGSNTVVGAGAVVTRDLPADVVAVGSPARVIRSL